jgi:hypothetical protein
MKGAKMKYITIHLKLNKPAMAMVHNLTSSCKKAQTMKGTEFFGCVWYCGCCCGCGLKKVVLKKVLLVEVGLKK